MHELHDWLSSNRDYEQGLALLKQHGCSSVLLQVLGAGPTVYNRNRLARELTQKVQKLQARQKHYAESPPASAKKTARNYGRKKREEYPEELHPAFDRQNALYKTVNHLHPQLEVLHELDQGRCAAACKAIVESWDEINSIYRILDYWTENGVILPNKYTPQKLPVLTRPEEISKRIAALRVYISRSKNKPKKVADVAAWKDELEELKIRLKELKTVAL